MRRLCAYLIAIVMLSASVFPAWAGEVVQFARPAPEISAPVAANDNALYAASSNFAQRLLQRMPVGNDGKFGIGELSVALGVPTAVLLPQIKMLSGSNDALSIRLTPEQFLSAAGGAATAMSGSGHDDCGMLWGLTFVLVANAWNVDHTAVQNAGNTASMYGLCPLH